MKRLKTFIIAILLCSFHLQANSDLNLQKPTALSDTIDFVSLMSQTIHYLQQERGASTGFVSSQGKKFQSLLQSIQHKSDTKKNALLNKLIQSQSTLVHYVHPEFSKDLKTLFSRLDHLRAQVRTLHIDFPKTYSQYTQIIAYLLLGISEISDTIKNKALSDKLYNYSTLLMYKESLGQKRAALSGLFSQKKFSKEIFEYYLTSDTQEKIYLKSFLHSANASLKTDYYTIIKNPINAKVKAYEALALKKLNGYDIALNPEVWFTAITKKINLIQSIEKKAIKEIRQLLFKLNATKTIHLTPNERAWLKKHPLIRYTGDPKWLPFEAFEKNGRYIGIVAEYLDKIESLTGIRFKRIATKNWSESVQLAENKKVDILSATTRFKRKNIRFTKPYLKNDIVIIMDKAHGYVSNLNEIKGLKIALVKDYGYSQQIKDAYPHITFIPVDTVKDGLTAVSTGQIDALLCTFALGSYASTQMGLSNIKIVGKTEFFIALGFGVREDYAPLISILNKAIEAITPTELNEILHHWIKQEYVEKVDYSLLYKVVGIALFLMTLFFFWNRKMAKEIEKRKEAEARIIQEKVHTDNMLNTITELIFSKDLNLVYTNVNDAFCTFMGLKKEQIIGKSDYDIFPKEVADSITAMDREVLQSGESLYFEEQVPNAQGALRYLFTQKHLLKDQRGIPYGMGGSVNDITKSKENEIRFATMFDAAPDSLTILKNGEYVECNQATLKLFGYKNIEEFLHSTPSSNSPKFQESGVSSESLAKEKIKEALEKGYASFEWKHIRHDTQEPFDAHVVLSKIILNGEAHIYAIVRDISEEKRAKKALDEERTFISSIISSSQDALVVIDTKGNVSQWNHSAETIFGYTQEEMLGQSVDKIIPPSYKALHHAGLKRVAQGGTPKLIGKGVIEIEAQRKDGAIIPIDLALNHFSIGDKRFFSANIRDITERKELTEKLKNEQRFTQTLLDSQKNIILSTDGEHIRSVNRAFLEFFDIDRLEAFTQKHNSICDLFEFQEGENYIQAEIEGQKWVDYIVAHPKKRHIARINQRLFVVNIVKSHFNHEDLFVAVFTDVTELEHYQSDLKLAMQTIENAPIDITYVNGKGDYTYVNTKFANDMGYRKEELVGKNILDLNPEASEESIKAFIQLIRKEKTLNFNNRPLKRHDGSIMKVHLSVAHALYKNREVITSYFFDITEQTKLQEELKNTNQKIQDSIEYASLIQSALIPESQSFHQHFSDLFTIWYPKDIVGGDIYLFETLRNQDESLLMVIDCTGHGVPGAFVTMLVKAIERQIVAKINSDPTIDVSPAWILSYFNKKMKQLLKQEDKDSLSNAGFDGGVVYYNQSKQMIKFAGAHTPLFYIQNDEVQTIKGSRHSIGYKTSKIDFEFKEHTIQVKKGMQFYLTTDGYLDQNGGEKGFPFGKARFKALIQKHFKESMADQKEHFLYTLKTYQGQEETNDDVTLVGFKI